MIIAIVYVDDIILTGDDSASVQHLKSHLHNIFSINDLGPLSFFLGIEVIYLSNGIAMTQKKFTTELIRDDIIPIIKSVTTHLLITLKLQHHDDSPPFSDPAYYRILVGKLNFLTHTRPDLSFTVQAFSQIMQVPTET